MVKNRWAKDTVFDRPSEKMISSFLSFVNEIWGISTARNGAMALSHNLGESTSFDHFP